MAYEWMRGTVELTPQLRAEINHWIATRPGAKHTPARLKPKDNVIIILCESLESWVFETSVEGQELTPNINALLRDSTTLYAPHVLSQVKGARSIDAQLILHTGLLPVEYGAYSYRFPHNTYHSLDKAWKQKYGNDARVMSFTVDKKTVWNVAIVAQDFGYEIYDKPYFVLDVKTGPRGRLGDTSFLRQSAQKLPTLQCGRRTDTRCCNVSPTRDIHPSSSPTNSRKFISATPYPNVCAITWKWPITPTAP